MRTIIPYLNLSENSWAEDFTTAPDIRRKYAHIQCIGHYVAKPGYGVYDRSDLNSILLLYTVEGCGIIRYLRREVRLPKGYATLIDCRSLHSYYCTCEDIWDFRWLHFDGSPIIGYVEDHMENWGISPLPEGEELFKDIYRDAKRNDRIGYVNCSTGIITACSKLLTGVISEDNDSFRSTLPVIGHAIEYYEEHYAENISLDSLCKRLNISKFYFSRKFKEQTGYSPCDYLTAVRINNAKSLLRSTNLSVEDIALRCGFSSATYFIRSFRKKENITPLGYRKYV